MNIPDSDSSLRFAATIFSSMTASGARASPDGVAPLPDGTRSGNRFAIIEQEVEGRERSNRLRLRSGGNTSPVSFLTGVFSSPSGGTVLLQFLPGVGVMEDVGCV